MPGAHVPDRERFPGEPHGGVGRETHLRVPGIVPALEAALASRRPAVVEIFADPSVPPLSPHTTPKQAKNYLLALMRGDLDALKVIRASAKELFA